MYFLVDEKDVIRFDGEKLAQVQGEKLLCF